jgi:4-hydroxy-tetrahydrodipicolinate reductase
MSITKQIKVIVNGANGKMGAESVQAIQNDPLLDCVATSDAEDDLLSLVAQHQPHVVLDFTHPSVVYTNTKSMIEQGVHTVVGTTGLTQEQLTELDTLSRQKGVGCLVCPNFAIGAVLMMQFATKAAAYLKEVEILEYHHPYKADAPSGTAIKTVDMITDAHPDMNASLKDLNSTEHIAGSKGGYYKNVPIHSVRLDSYIASQEVLMAGAGQRLTLRHDSIDRSSFMPGVCLAIQKVGGLTGLTYGLEHIL